MDVMVSLAGLSVGFLIGLTGVGGGAIMTPLLIFGFGIPAAVAVGTDLLYAAFTKLGGVWSHARQNTVDWGVVARLASGSIPAAILTLIVLNQMKVNDQQANLDLLITTTLGVALIVTALSLLLRHRLREAKFAWVLRWQKPGTVVVGVVVGVMVTVSSVGAGALGAAALFWLYPRLSAARVVGTDIAHAVPLTAVAGFGHWQLGNVDYVLLGTLLLGSLPGIYLGSRFSTKLPEQIMRPMMAVLLMAIGIRLVA